MAQVGLAMPGFIGIRRKSVVRTSLQKRRHRGVVLAVAASVAVALISAGPVLARDARPGQTQVSPAGKAVGAAVTRHDAPLSTTKRMMRTIKDLVAMGPRKTGTPAGRKAAQYVAKELRKAGMDKVWIEKATSYSWKARDFGLSVGGTKVPVQPVGFSMISSPTATGVRTLGPKGLTAPVVDLTKNPLANPQGKIAIVDLKFQLPLVALVPFMEYLYDPKFEALDLKTLLTANPYITSLSSTIKQLQAKGAVGVIGVLSDYFDSDKYRNEYYRRTPMNLPGMWITANNATKLRALLAKDPNATMRLTTVRKKVTTRVPIGILKGATKDTIMVQSHHDSVTPGAVEDGTGVAEVLALARYYGALAKKAPQRQKTLMFTTMDSHFTGYQAHMAFVDKYIKNPKSPYHIVANTTIEHIARKGVIKNGKLVITKQSEPKAIFENVSLKLKGEVARAIKAHNLHGTALLNGTLFQLLSLPTDAAFVQSAGVPTLSLISGPVYLYDDADTIKAVDKPQLRPVLAAERDLVDAFEATPSKQIGFLPFTLPALL